MKNEKSKRFVLSGWSVQKRNSRKNSNCVRFILRLERNKEFYCSVDGLVCAPINTQFV